MATDSGPRPTTPAVGGPAIDRGIFTPQQWVFYTVLTEQQQRPGKRYQLAAWYGGVVTVRSQSGNLDCLSHAAHGVRELMEKLARDEGIVTAQASGLTDQVRKLCEQWRGYTSFSGNASKRDTKLVSFHKKLEKFVVWFERLDRKREQVFGDLLDQLDHRKVKLPGPIKDNHVQAWDTFHKYFLDVSHHRRDTTPEEFDAYLDALERFLLDRLRPRTFEDRAALKAIIAEGESDA